MAFQSEEEMLTAMAEMIHQGTGLTLDIEQVKALLLEVQREQLKGLVYRAFLAVNQAKEEGAEEAPELCTLTTSGRLR
jgi:hypothetical protein